MSAALKLFRERKANLARRSRLYADMRFAGEEAAFCLREVRATLALARSIRRIEDERARRDRAVVAAMTPAERANRIRDILAQLETVDYLPLGISASDRARELEDELKSLRSPLTPGDRADPGSPIAAVQTALA